jgi:hypothetical protein
MREITANSSSSSFDEQQIPTSTIDQSLDEVPLVEEEGEEDDDNDDDDDDNNENEALDEQTLTTASIAHSTSRFFASPFLQSQYSFQVSPDKSIPGLSPATKSDSKVPLIAPPPIIAHQYKPFISPDRNDTTDMSIINQSTEYDEKQVMVIDEEGDEEEDEVHEYNEEDEEGEVDRESNCYHS